MISDNEFRRNRKRSVCLCELWWRISSRQRWDSHVSVVTVFSNLPLNSSLHYQQKFSLTGLKTALLPGSVIFSDRQHRQELKATWSRLNRQSGGTVIPGEGPVTRNSVSLQKWMGLLVVKEYVVQRWRASEIIHKLLLLRHLLSVKFIGYVWRELLHLSTPLDMFSYRLILLCY